MKCIFYWFAIIAIILVVIWWGFQRTHAPADPSVQEIDREKNPTQVPVVANMIQVTAPVINSILTSPLTITGRARGPWYFEASFPIELKVSNGTVIAKTVAQAQGNWMTANWVSFTATLSYPPQPTGSTGSLVLKKDNPSGEPQNDMSLVIPVQF